MSFSIRYYLSERYRLRFEDAGIEDMVEGEGDEQDQGTLDHMNARDLAKEDLLEADDVKYEAQAEQFAPEMGAGTVRTLDGEIAGDEFAQDAINYQILLGKIDTLLEKLDLDA